MKINVHTFYTRQVSLPFSSPVKKQVDPIKGDFERSFRIGNEAFAPALKLTPFATSHFLNPWQLLVVIGQFLVLQQSETMNLPLFDWKVSALPQFQLQEFSSVEKMWEKRIAEKGGKASASSVDLNTAPVVQSTATIENLGQPKGSQKNSSQLEEFINLETSNSLSTRALQSSQRATSLNEHMGSSRMLRSAPLAPHTNGASTSFSNTIETIVAKVVTNLTDFLSIPFAGGNLKHQQMDPVKKESPSKSNPISGFSMDPREQEAGGGIALSPLEALLKALGAIGDADCGCRDKAMDTAGPDSFLNSSFAAEPEDKAFHQNFISAMCARLSAIFGKGFPHVIALRGQSTSDPAKEYLTKVFGIFKSFLTTKGQKSYEEHPVVVMPGYGFTNIYQERLEFVLFYIAKLGFSPISSVANYVRDNFDSKANEILGKLFVKGRHSYGPDATSNKDYQLPHSAKKLIEQDFPQVPLRGNPSGPDDPWLS